MQTKACSKCAQEKPLAEFYKNCKARDGLTTSCRVCTDVVNAAYRAKNQDRIKEMKREYQRKHMDAMRDAHYRKKYGISLEEFNALFDLQKGACAICGTSEYSSRMQFAKLLVDHCHVAGKVRGLLCKSCNIGLGEFKDDPRLLIAAAAYLHD